MERVEEISNFMETHTGREKLLRLVQYTAVFASGVTAAEGGLYDIAGRISTARTLLRLFDDAAMIVSARDTLRTLDVSRLCCRYDMHRGYTTSKWGPILGRRGVGLAA